MEVPRLKKLLEKVLIVEEFKNDSALYKWTKIFKYCDDS